MSGRSRPRLGTGRPAAQGPGADLGGARFGRCGRLIEFGDVEPDRRDALQRSVFGTRPCVCGGQEPVGPFLGELAGLAEHDRHVGPADLQFGQPVGDHGGTDALKLEQLRVAVLDDDRRARQRGQIGDLIAQLAAGQAGDQIGQGFAFHAGEQPPVDDEAVVAARQRPPHGADLLGDKPVGVLLVRVDQDLQPLDAVGARGRGTHVRTGLLAGARRLPEHRVAAPRGGEHQLRAVLPRPLQNHIDGRAAALARAQRRGARRSPHPSGHSSRPTG